LQSAFNKNKIQRHIDVDKLIRAKYQDNLEFCQWLKAFFDQAGTIRDNYDAAAIRARGKGGKKYNEFLEKTASKHGSKPLPAARNRTTTRAAPVPSPRNNPRPAPTTTRATARHVPVKTTAARTTKAPVKPKVPLRSTENKNIPSNAAKVQKAQADAELMKKNAAMSQKVEELETSMAEIEKERDFYFGKLRNVELMLQVNQDNNFEGTDLETVVGSIFKVLYATAEEDVIVSEVGEVSFVVVIIDFLVSLSLAIHTVPSRRSFQRRMKCRN
jgi:RP/EB family microtubule-associated protein